MIKLKHSFLISLYLLIFTLILIKGSPIAPALFISLTLAPFVVYMTNVITKDEDRINRDDVIEAINILEVRKSWLSEMDIDTLKAYNLAIKVLEEKLK